LYLQDGNSGRERLRKEKEMAKLKKRLELISIKKSKTV